MDKEQIYIKLETRYTAEPNSSVLLTDVAEVYCRNSDVQKYLENLKIYKAKEEEISDFVSAIDIINKIENTRNDVEVNMIGKEEILIEVKSSTKKNNFFKILKVLIVCISLFLGAGLAIVNFHEDVNMKDSMEKLYFIVTGEGKSNPLIMLIPYSIGIGIGMTAFFSSNFSNKSRRKEPGPLEVEMDLYNKNVDEFMIQKIKDTNNPL
ncbi:MAG: Stage V sporulation protein AA [Sporanaerobacter sp.]|uniref:stage V sporulation protein AA n=1 Tax=Sporanaerobacter sp. TaxID=2010183 RepID=UPI003A102AD2